ncbi:GlcG/HbpS family heme-binding protein [Rhizobium phaseoli]|uniref:GlcG/HbpS family heme-binding protein n=1 Tax=Rhizobium phaseoli TaxID=396 RepID=UPI000BEA4253|nr:heme-binding protein [Rhizobium phaseoli]PDS27461.1 DNA polymerase III subunit delta' [Rhizobium phaseoli]
MVRIITHEEALNAIAAGAAKVREMKQPSSLAIVDLGGNLLAFLRVDDAALSTVQIAQNKAWTSLALRSPSGQWMEAVQPNAPLYGLESVGARPFVVFGGGLPITRDGKVVGAVGVSGGPVDDDLAIAEAMLAALG